MSSSADLFYVKLADGDVHRVSLEQLDDAFQAGHIDGSTMVLAAGATQWTTLGELAGIDDEGEGADGEREEVAPVQVIPQNAPRMPGPSAMAYTLPMQPTPPQRQAPAAQGPSQWQPQGPQTLPQWGAPSAQPQWQSQAPQAQRPMYAPAYAAPAIQVPAYGLGQTSPMPAVRNQMPPVATPNSMRPVSVDLGVYDPDAIKGRRGSGKRWVSALALLSVIGAVAGIAVTRPPWARSYLRRVGLQAPAVVEAAAPPPAAVEMPPPPPSAPPPLPPQQVAPPPAASGATAAGDSPLNPHFTDRFTPEQKQKLAEADKKPKGHAKAAPSHGGSKAKSSTFTTGGSKYDPLNSSI